MRGLRRAFPRRRPPRGAARVSRHGAGRAGCGRRRVVAGRSRLPVGSVDRPHLHGHRRTGPGAGNAGDGGAARADPRLPRTAGAAAGRALRAGTRRGDRARGGGILPAVTKSIYIFSPSSAVRNKAALRRSVARLKAMGHDVELDTAALASHMRFAGDDETRLAAIGRAAASGADVAMISRGGYGLSRLLPRLPYDALAKASEHGTRFVGYSDFTALQNAVLAETGKVTWAGPAAGEDFGVDGEPDDIMQACFEDLLEGQGEGTGWQLPRAEALEQPLEARGILWGGNLAMVASLAGTPWLPKAKGILFLEDVSEHPYRIERMLTQLLYAGVLAKQKAIVLGQFTNYVSVPHDKGYKLKTVVDWLRQQVDVPVLTGLPFGHVPTKVCLPVGAKVTLAAEGRDAFLLWGHIGTGHSHDSHDGHDHAHH
ncbi:MAG: LD-carboxypeptidase [Comamonadaceae bacterium]|nr:MAG: LD-carboxypeptidase [Comamonadaceae bacterium]